MFHFLFKTHLKKTILVLVLLGIWYFFALPKPLFTDPTCMVLEDQSGDLLGARIATDGQWRFPHQKEVPEKFQEAIIEFEDRRFQYHIGIDPVGIGRAIVQNIRNQRIVSGGSTLSMQVIRMARKDKARSIFQKIIEAILATRLELRYSKAEIMRLYASHAPFGGNVVGLDAASWRYYAKQAQYLSWGEAATLAVLPNSPALIHPGRNRQALLEKRNRLLDRLQAKGAIDVMTCSLAKEEPLPQKPLPLPRLAPHLLDRAYLEQIKGKKDKLSKVKTTLDRSLQEQVIRLVNKQHDLLKGNEIHNAAAIVVEVKTGKVRAYVGNAPKTGAAHGQDVDIIMAPRSTGSILKPFLSAFAMQDGLVLPQTVLSDVPTYMNGYRPENYHESYDGVISMDRALSRSLNIPFIRLLSKYGLEKFHHNLQELKLRHINKAANHYGLPLIVGGAESCLWDITQAYTGMSRTLANFYPQNGQYNEKDFDSIQYLYSEEEEEIVLNDEGPVLSASTIWHTFEAMQALERPSGEGNWEYFQSSEQIAWKTGTSYGFRDAWAIGATPDYVVGIWVGNADGEGRPGLVGVQAAAPLLFDIFDVLPSSGEWFSPPYDEMVFVPVCKQSGHRALPICEQDSTWIPLSGLRSKACSYHQLVHLDEQEEYQVHASCTDVNTIQHKGWFILPPVEEHYYKIKHPNYQDLPDFRKDCQGEELVENKNMQLIYPKNKAKIYIPKDLDGSKSETVFKVAHRKKEEAIYWHVDNTFIGSTVNFHEMALQPSVGKHTLTLVDEQGERLVQEFEILGEESED